MSRYGWSSRSPISPYASMTGPAHVEDGDFSYITSQDLDDPTLSAPVDDVRHSKSYASASPNPDDDVLLIKNKGVIYPAHFPAYSIGDGKLIVADVMERVGLLMELSPRTQRRIKLLYKGKQLKDGRAPIREYGCKNKSELMAVVPEGDDGSSLSEEEMVIVGDRQDEDSKSKRKRKRRGKKNKDLGSPGEGDTTSSPRDSNSNFEGPHSPSSATSTGPMKVLSDLSNEYKTKWAPLCQQYIDSPPDDDKKRTDEHRRISESVMQHVILKLDGVETEGNPEIRTRRKALVTLVQDTLKQLDVAKASAGK